MQLQDHTLEYPRNCFANGFDVPFQNDYLIGSHWLHIRERTLEAIRQFKTPEEAVLYAQNGGVSGFNHRARGHRWSIEFKAREITRVFPGFDFDKHPELTESSYSNPETLEQIGESQFSNIFLTHLNHYLRSTAGLEKSDVKNVLEIGAGYGGLARIFKLMAPSVRYTIVDLPESLFFAQVFLSLNFPDTRITYVTDAEDVEFDQSDFVLVPAQRCDLLSGKSFDIAINTGSMQEMPEATVKFWMNFIERVIDVKRFYSFNYFMNNTRRYIETSRSEANLMCPVLDPYWSSMYFRMNSAVPTIDVRGRNWLELCLERTPNEKRQPNELPNQACLLRQQAKLQPIGSNEWFEKMWMAIWYSPDDHGLIREMVEGIRQYRLGLGTENYLAWSNRGDHQTFRNFLKVNYRYAKHLLRVYTNAGLAALHINNSRREPRYSEEIYYSRMLGQAD